MAWITALLSLLESRNLECGYGPAEMTSRVKETMSGIQLVQVWTTLTGLAKSLWVMGTALRCGQMTKAKVLENGMMRYVTILIIFTRHCAKFFSIVIKSSSADKISHPCLQVDVIYKF